MYSLPARRTPSYDPNGAFQPGARSGFAATCPTERAISRPSRITGMDDLPWPSRPGSGAQLPARATVARGLTIAAHAPEAHLTAAAATCAAAPKKITHLRHMRGWALIP